MKASEEIPPAKAAEMLLEVLRKSTEKVLELEDRISKLELSLCKAGICPACGGKIDRKEDSTGSFIVHRYVCSHCGCIRVEVP